MKKIFFLALTSLIIISGLLIINNKNKAFAQENNSEKIRVVYFYTVDCTKCQKIKPFIKKVKEKYGDKIDFLEYNVKKEEQYRQLFYNFVQKYNVPDDQAKTPLFFVGNNYLTGPDSITNYLEEKINKSINDNENLRFDCYEFLDSWPNVDRIDFLESRSSDVYNIKEEIYSVENKSNNRKKISLTLLITTAAIDSVNPCAIAVLIFLITVLISLKTSRKRMLQIGMIYIGTVFTTYYLTGLGLMRIITRFDITTQIGLLAGVIVLLAGFLEIKEGLCPNGKQLLIIPKKTKPIFIKLLRKGTIPSVVIAGVLISAFELPCTGQIYLAILSMLSQESLQMQGYLYLFIYNIIFVLPLVIILFIATWGFDINKIENIRLKTRIIVKTLIGLVMILLGLFLLYQNHILKIFEK